MATADEAKTNETEESAEETSNEETTSTPEETSDDVIETSGEDLYSDLGDEPDDLDEEAAEADDDLEIVKADAESETPAEEKAEAEKGEEAKEAEKAEEGKEGDKAEKPAEAEKSSEEPKPETQQPPEAEKPEEAAKPEVAPQQPDLAAIHEQFENWRGESEKLLSEQHYNFSEEQVEELRNDDVPESLINAIPGMMSRVYLDSVTMAMGQIVQNLPHLISMVTEQQAAQSQGEAAFFEQWPQLKEHTDTVRAIGAAYRQANPKASPEDFIKQVGASAMVSLQLPIEGAAPAAEEAKPAAPAFKPASTGTPAGTPPPKKGEWDKTDEELFGEEDAEYGT